MTLPSGTVTFLFTDIEGSTRLVARVGDEAYRDLLDAERRLVLDAAVEQGGVPFGSEGDAHFVAFAAAPHAVRAAVSAQRALASYAWPHGPVRVRMGLHSGEARVAGDDYVGLELHRAARIAAAAHGGQVLVSSSTRSLAQAATGDGIGFLDLGALRLRDFPAPETLFQLTADGLDTAFPPPRTLTTHPTNLPAQLTSFVGRSELLETRGLLERSRLLTLTGPGGTGKTRLSLALAVDAADAYPGGTWFVPLASVRDGDLVLPSIATALGLVNPSQPPIERLAAQLAERPTLLVLDNLEQVIDEAAPLLADLLARAPLVSLVVSSRIPLRIRGEQEFPVPPLPVPPPRATDRGAIAAFDAVRLFVERASAVRPGFALTDANAADVAEIVRRLDGLPLAIELAAARTRTLHPAAMVKRLNDRLALLDAGGRDVTDRQRTLRGAVDWSVQLLRPPARRLFARLAVFEGGGSLEIADRVCALAEDAPPLDVFAGIEHLGEQSLLRVVEGPAGEVRFTMLETIREVAAEELRSSGELEALRDRHAEAFLERACGNEPGESMGRGEELDRLEADGDNFRLAIRRFLETDRVSDAASLVHALWRFWQMRGRIEEGRALASAVLERPELADGDMLHAAEAAGGLAYWAADMTAAAGFYADAEAAARRLGDEAELANALYNRFFAGASGTREEWTRALASPSQPYLEQAIAIWTRLGDDAGRARGLWALGEHYTYRREPELATRALDEALAIFDRRNDEFWSSWARFTRSLARAELEDSRGAAEDLRACARLFQAARDGSGEALAISAMSGLLVRAGRTETAYELGGAARRATEETGVRLGDRWPDYFEAVDEATTDPVLAEALARGARMAREEAMQVLISAAEDLIGAPVSPAGSA